ncbi:hypothetical protein HPP92_002968 [Vanilla planifolia]|uniref:Glycosyltransferase 61 catalytic domain-containing protein n=1 Tax=Vanilla planifolia TaxID=51239 RepID=A0A835VGS6_VANPL|nr:hypothetical protein HPP92_002968 [Vanilla planifolia]
MADGHQEIKKPEAERKTTMHGYLKLLLIVFSIAMCGVLCAARSMYLAVAPGSESNGVTLVRPNTKFTDLGDCNWFKSATCGDEVEEEDDRWGVLNNEVTVRCSSIPNNTLCCDQSSPDSDVCFLRGDVRTHPSSSSVLLVGSSSPLKTILPYPRKWDTSVAARSATLSLLPTSYAPSCDVVHSVPAVVFATDAFAGNLFHAFNEGLVPLFLTSHHLRRRVALVILHYKHWWHSKYSDILRQISAFPPVDFAAGNKTHCFSSAIVGLRFHGVLSLDPSRSKNHASMSAFRRLLAEAYHKPGHNSRLRRRSRRPKLVIISREKTRVIENEADVTALAEEVGFEVEVVRPSDRLPLSAVYEALSVSEAMLGVHGAAMAHLLFLRRKAAVVEVVPLGLERLASGCFGVPAARIGLKYEEYRVDARESSLSRRYGEGHEEAADLQHN